MNAPDDHVDPDLGDEVGLDLVALPVEEVSPQEDVEQPQHEPVEASEPPVDPMAFPTDDGLSSPATKIDDAGLQYEPQEPLQQPPAPPAFLSTVAAPGAALAAFQRPQMPTRFSRSMVLAKLLRESNGAARPSGLDRLRQQRRNAS